jgi:glycosyltransferase involved in cell wall biosynthesis
VSAVGSPWPTASSLYAGRVDPRKGIDLAIRALTALPGDATLTIDGAGDDEHLAELRQLAERCGLSDRVTFGTRERVRLREAYGQADAVVFPVRWDEPWGLVPLESMAVGTPVLATGRGGSSEYLSNGHNCLLFDPDAGAEALAAAVRRLADDEPLRERLRAGGFQTATGLRAEDWDREVERLHLRAAGAER